MAGLLSGDANAWHVVISTASNSDCFVHLERLGLGDIALVKKSEMI